MKAFSGICIFAVYKSITTRIIAKTIASMNLGSKYKYPISVQLVVTAVGFGLSAVLVEADSPSFLRAPFFRRLL
jgi:hypothetical protein